jgi:hypothetical protein
LLYVADGIVLNSWVIDILHWSQNLAKQRALEFGRTNISGTVAQEEDIVITTEVSEEQILNDARGPRLADDLEKKPRGFFADQFEVSQFLSHWH